MDFIDHHGSHPGGRIFSPQSQGLLSHVIHLSLAIDVSSQRHAVGRRPKVKTLTVAGQLSGGIRRKKVGGFSQRTEGETPFGTWHGMEL